ncbi:hypothetical protein ACIQIE_20075 [Streptomyces globisporus]|uniref:hypothetical protein n=1 Tax=Streptomyces globisporus TaxID=1908 RepID=UPI0034614B9D|nr:hypothetical protein OG838_02940 [Streptomyces globisporus]
MSPFVSTDLSVLIDADLAATFGTIRELRQQVLVADITASHEEHDALGAAEITTRFVAAVRAGDRLAEFELWELAREYDRSQPFGPRLVDELDGLSTPAAA